MSLSNFSEEHEQLRLAVGKYLDKEVVAKHTRWSEEGITPEHELRAIYEQMGELGWLMPWAERKYGGSETNFLTSYVICNEIGKRALSGITTWLHSEVAGPYLGHFANEEQKKRFLPELIAGKKILCLAMTEPDTGSDLAAIRTSAVKSGDFYIINGNKCFISGGIVADIIIMVCKTNSNAKASKRLSIFLVDSNTPGITRQRMKKIGGNVLDNAEIHFDNVRVPKENLLGHEGNGMDMLMQNLQRERLIASINYQGMAERALDLAIQYANTRVIFGQKVAKFQNTEFTLSDMYTKIQAGRALIEQIAIKINDNHDSYQLMPLASAAKLYTAELAQECIRKSLQIHGGYGVCQEFEIGRMYASSPTTTIAAGTSEIMKYIIGRHLASENRTNDSKS